MTSGLDTISFILSRTKRSSSPVAPSSVINVLNVLSTLIDRLDVATKVYKVSIPHSDNMLLVLCPIVELFRRQRFWGLDPKPRHKQIEQRFRVRERLVR
jgi:hypothetical protein